ncbi:hypothetical protein L9F63_002396, partial [Diploptera punctata]
DCIRYGLDETETVFNVISAFEIPVFTYNCERKKFLKINNGNAHAEMPQLFDVPAAKAFLYKNRYTILLQRTQRHDLFKPTLLGLSSENQKPKLQPIEFLLSSSGKVSGVIILGMLTQLKEDHYHLEDPTGIVKLDLKKQININIENCFILVEGYYEDKIFHVNEVGFPPAETAATSRAYFGNVNTFGGPSQVSLKTSAELLRYEQENEDGIIVFLADLWLDNIKVMEKLRVLFAGYADFPPVAFVFMGNFLSSQQGSVHTATLKTKLKSLADLITQFPELLEKSKFIFIPGPSDPASPNIFPKFPLPKYITDDFQQRVPTSVFTTNPCRIQYCTHEIVVIREDLVTKMCRNAVHFPDSGEISEHFTRTILCQAHLAPIPLSVSPVYWSFDTAMQLYPLPDLVVVADQSNSFSTEFMECQVTNPGSFPKNEFSFKIYIPGARRVEDSQIPND